MNEHDTPDLFQAVLATITARTIGVSRRSILLSAIDCGEWPTSTAALQFSATPDVAVSLIVGAHTEAQALANASSIKVIIPQAFWAELKRQNLIEQNAPIPEGGA